MLTPEEMRIKALELSISKLGNEMLATAYSAYLAAKLAGNEEGIKAMEEMFNSPEFVKQYGKPEEYLEKYGISLSF